MKPNFAKVHKKTRGLAEIYKLADEINKISQGGIVDRNWQALISTRDNAAALMGKIMGLEDDLQALEKDSPCYSCKKVK